LKEDVDMRPDRTPAPTRRTWKTAAAGAALASLTLGPIPVHAQSSGAVSPSSLATPQHGPLEARALLELADPVETSWSRPASSGQPTDRLPLRGIATDHRGSSGQWSPVAPRGVRPRSISRKVVFGLLGAAGGFLIGGTIGARIEGNSCACDDPGMKGWIIGAPVGAIFGGFFGVKLAGR
jgi:hypothetical protein